MHQDGSRTTVDAEQAAHYFERLDAAWEPVVRRWRAHNGPVTVLFSGGVDSGLVAWELRSHPHLDLATVGTARAADLAASESAARSLGLPWNGTVVEKPEIDRLAARLVEELAGLPAASRAIFLALAAAIEAARSPQLLCGQGADELFLGYAHYRGLSSSAAAARSASDLSRLLTEDWPRTERIAARLGRRIDAPYLEVGFRAAVQSVPIGDRQPFPEPKALFRAWARHRGLPDSVASRPKKALQFGSGVERLLRRDARRVN
jgi:asparagine synthase (glutamine-hydrolysing)